jgi:predicted aspartyl protease
MGRTTDKVTIKNYVDEVNAASGALDPSRVRTVDVLGVVDTGAAYLCLPPSAIQQLGLLFLRNTRVRTANGAVQRRIFGGAAITVRERSIEMAVMENDEDTPSLIGYLVLEALDFVVDPKGETLMGNPEHDGEWIVDLY